MNKKQHYADLAAYLEETIATAPAQAETRKDLFLRYIELHSEARKKAMAIYKAGLDIVNFLDDYYSMANCLMHLTFNPAQVEIIDWWLYDSSDKVISWPEEGREWRLDTPEQLWDYLETIGAQ